MSALNLLKASLFSTAQTAWLIVIAVIVVALIAGNVFLWYYFHKAGERKLCTRQLQQRREELLQRLVELKMGTPAPAASAEQFGQEETVDFADEEEDEEYEEDEEEQKFAEEGMESAESAENAANEDGEDGDEELTTEVLPVTAMSAEMRNRFGLTGEEHEDKKFIVRYSYSFEARLRNADAEVQARYVEFANEVGLYKGVKIKNSYKQQRIFKGKKTLGLILFRGKVLCVAFALDPSEYMATKYRGLDKSKKKRFEKTPMLYKISSTRRLEYAKYLLLQVADKNTIVMNEEPEKSEYNLQPIGRDDMYASGLMRINIVRELLDEAELEAAATQTEEQAIPEATVAEETPVEAVPAQSVAEVPAEQVPIEEAPVQPAEEAPAKAEEEE